MNWLAKIGAFRHDPVGFKRLSGRNLSRRLNDAGRGIKDSVALAAGKPGDPPSGGAHPPAISEGVGLTSACAPLEATPVLSEIAVSRAVARQTESAELVEIMAILRPGKRQATRQALETVGVVAYTAVPVLGRSRQRGLRFKDNQAADVAIRFLPKLLVTVVMEASRADAAVQAIIKANRTGRGEYGDGKIFVLDVGEAVRISTDERGNAAVS